MLVRKLFSFSLCSDIDESLFTYIFQIYDTSNLIPFFFHLFRYRWVRKFSLSEWRFVFRHNKRLLLWVQKWIPWITLRRRWVYILHECSEVLFSIKRMPGVLTELHNVFPINSTYYLYNRGIERVRYLTAFSNCKKIVLSRYLHASR